MKGAARRERQLGQAGGFDAAGYRPWQRGLLVRQGAAMGLVDEQAHDLDVAQESRQLEALDALEAVDRFGFGSGFTLGFKHIRRVGIRSGPDGLDQFCIAAVAEQEQAQGLVLAESGGEGDGSEAREVGDVQVRVQKGPEKGDAVVAVQEHELVEEGVAVDRIEAPTIQGLINAEGAQEFQQGGRRGGGESMGDGIVALWDDKRRSREESRKMMISIKTRF